MPHLLLLSGDDACRQLLGELAQYRVSQFTDTQSLLQSLQLHNADVLIIDTCLPIPNQQAWIAKLREQFTLPILLLNDADNELDALESLQAGADQYISKPVTLNALSVHVAVLLRRVELEKRRKLTEAGNTHYSLKIETLPLTETEQQLTRYLRESNGCVVSKATLQKEVLKKELSVFDRNLDVHISNIRRKLNLAGFSKKHIKTVHGKGYAFFDNIKHLSMIIFLFL